MTACRVFVTLSLTVLLSNCASWRPGPSALVDEAIPGYQIEDAIALGLLIEVAYQLFDQSPDIVNPNFPEPFAKGFKPLVNLIGKDKPGSEQEEFYGHISQRNDQPETLVISIRGTSDAQEWLDDAKFFMVDYPPDPKAGKVERGFNEIFESFTVAVPGNPRQITLAEYLSQQSAKRIVVTGHSLGSSLATLVAFDTADSYAEQVELFTFASPYTGNRRFVNSFESRISDSIRLVNSPDVVPKVPPYWVGYRHVPRKVSIDSRDDKSIRHSLMCYHSLQTYLHMLDPSIELEKPCQL